MTTPIEELADRYLERWKYAGDEQISAPCPFHAEKTPGAFYINKYTGLYFCHGCLASGNVVTFLKEMKAPRSMIDIAVAAVGSTAHKKPRHTEHILNEALLGVFDFCPTSLVEQGFDPAVLRAHDVGFDKEYMRITFPIRDLRGQLVGISGRTVTNAKPRYMVYQGKDLERFNEAYRNHKMWKSDYLWRMDRVYPQIYHGTQNRLFVVEGYKACLWMVQHGRDNTVALQGVHLSDEQLRQIQRTDAEVILFLDNTASAREATVRAGRRIAETNTVSVVRYPPHMEDGDQPDDMDEDTLREATKGTIPLRRFRHG